MCLFQYWFLQGIYLAVGLLGHQFSSVSQSCPTLCDPMDRSPPGSSIRGIFQARALEWGAIAFSAILHYQGVKHDLSNEGTVRHGAHRWGSFWEVKAP